MNTLYWLEWEKLAEFLLEYFSSYDIYFEFIFHYIFICGKRLDAIFVFELLVSAGQENTIQEHSNVKQDKILL